MYHYDIVYQSKVFTDEYSPDITWIPDADVIHKGGTGYGLDNKLPDEIEHMYPDYSLYGITDTAYGFLTRGCPRHCGFCIVGDKEGLRSQKVADLSEFWNGQKNIVLLDPNLLACREHPDLIRQLIDSRAYVEFNQGIDIRLTNEQNIALINQVKLRNIHFAWDNAEDDLTPFFRRYSEQARHKPHGDYGMVYVLVNYGSTMEQNLYRIYTLREMGFDPYVMVFDKPNAPKEIKRLQRWVNNKFIFKKCRRFEEYAE